MQPAFIDANGVKLAYLEQGTGPLVVLVHGLSVPYYIWDSTAASLAAAGHRVIRYDEYGR